MTKKEIGDYMANKMREAGFTCQTELAEASGLCQSQISKVLKGEGLGKKTIEKLAPIFKCTPEKLLNMAKLRNTKSFNYNTAINKNFLEALSSIPHDVQTTDILLFTNAKLEDALGITISVESYRCLLEDYFRKN